MPYIFYLDGAALPIAPARLDLKVKNQNKSVTLINEGEINILKDAGLTEISLDARLPQQKYPFGGGENAASWLSKLETAKTGKKPFRFIVTRTRPDGSMLFDTNLLVSLEDYTVEEDAGEGFDLMVSLKLKQFREYGVKTVKVQETSSGTASATVSSARSTAGAPSITKCMVSSGEQLRDIAQKYLGNESRYREIYEMNQDLIDRTNMGTGNTRFTIHPGQNLRLPER